MKKKDKSMIEKLSRSAAITAVLTELIKRIEEGSSTAAAKSRNRSFLERSIDGVYKKNLRDLKKAFKDIPSKERYSLRRSSIMTLENSIEVNKRAVKRLQLDEEISEWLTGCDA